MLIGAFTLVIIVAISDIFYKQCASNSHQQHGNPHNKIITMCMPCQYHESTIDTTLHRPQLSTLHLLSPKSHTLETQTLTNQNNKTMQSTTTQSQHNLSPSTTNSTLSATKMLLYIVYFSRYNVLLHQDPHKKYFSASTIGPN